MNSGQANKAAIRVVLWSALLLAAFFAGAWIGRELGGLILAFHKVFIVLWALLIVAVLYLFRDPDPIEPADPLAIVSPAHGRVDVIDEAVENEFMQEACKRVSIQMSLLNVQVQYAPAAGTVAHLRHHAPSRIPRPEPETAWIGFHVPGRAQAKLMVRLMAGSWGTRIAPWVTLNDVVGRGVRMAMMRPGSRVELYLPRAVKLHVSVGDELVGGQSVVARFE
jgi:phosphatidylserine decarboxylase